MRGLRFEIENFRSFEYAQEISFESSALVVTGRNNSGKSNILRAVASIYNPYKPVDYSDIDDLLFDRQKGGFLFSIFVDVNSLPPLSKLKSGILFNLVRDHGPIEIPYIVNAKQLVLNIQKIKNSLGKIIPRGQDQNYCQQLFSSWSSDRDDNIGSIAGSFDICSYFQVGTIYVPSFRHITSPGAQLQSFVPTRLPGESISFQNIVTMLQSFDRPAASNLEDKDKLKRIESMISYCLEANVHIEVANDRSAIFLIIDGRHHNLRALGTGIEQLVIVATAAVGFDNRIVLLEEPELHLHPRVQRRMLMYFKEHSTNLFVITTHSGAVIDAEQADVVHVRHDGIRSVVSSVVLRSDRYQLVDDLGYRPSDMVQSNFIIWVEGPSDRIYLNYWISRIDPKLTEGVDYSILFYGGRLLSHLSFTEEDEDFIQVLDVNHHAAILIDSDKNNSKARINATKSRIRKECEERDVLVWFTSGREVENYIHPSDLYALSAEFPGISQNAGQFDKVISGEKINKVAFALAATSRPLNMENLDLMAYLNKLVGRIRAVKS